MQIFPQTLPDISIKTVPESFLAYEVSRSIPSSAGPVFVVVDSMDALRRLYGDLSTWLNGETNNIVIFEDPLRISCYERILGKDEKDIIVLLTGSKFSSPAVSPKSWKEERFVLLPGSPLSPQAFVSRCAQMGYQVVSYVTEPGQLCVRGGIVDVFSCTGEFPLRIEFDADRVQSMRSFDLFTQRSLTSISSVVITPAREILEEGKKFYEILPDFSTVFLFQSTVEDKTRETLSRKNVNCFYVNDFPAPAPLFYGNLNHALQQVREWIEHKHKVFIYTKYEESAREHFLKNGMAPEICRGELSSGFVLPEKGFVLITDRELFNQPVTPRRVPQAGVCIESAVDLRAGDFVVHRTFGIARYLGVFRLVSQGSESEYFSLQYAGKDKLYVPIDQIVRLTRYISSDGRPPKLSSLGGSQWELTKKRVKKQAQKVAEELLSLYSSREAVPGFAHEKDTPWQKPLEDAFEFCVTPDQEKASLDVKRDMEKPRPMDRLVCGDVGFGKTEVAVRAAFKAVCSGKQVAVLVPTTVLAEQHGETFRHRMAPFPVSVEVLSRFKTKERQKRIIKTLFAGTVDVVIGTHRILQKDIIFKELGLLVIDEEQRFGVLQKERVKKMKASVDVLTLTATPIPRTLYMSFLGIRDVSLMDTPPEDRLSIKTHILPFSEETIRKAIEYELNRGGQVYYVSNRVQTMQKEVERLKGLVPQCRITSAHGQMSAYALEKTMMDFFNRKYDVLACTSIIESGLDLPNVNTILIKDADTFGLADCYQLRGRVGRSTAQAYAYFLYDSHRPMSRQALERLTALKEFSRLGSGMALARRDLEIRGAGNLLGKEQSGFAAQVGFDLYCQLLSEAVAELKGKIPAEEEQETAVKLPWDAYFPLHYVPSETMRLQLYRKLAECGDDKDIELLKEELVDRFGPVPPAAAALLEGARIRQLARAARLKEVDVLRDRVVMRFRDQSDYHETAGLVELLKRMDPSVRYNITLSASSLVFSTWGLYKEEQMDILLKLLMVLALKKGENE